MTGTARTSPAPKWLPAVMVILAALILAVGAVSATDLQPGRIVAVGDVHGSLDGLTAILKQSGLIDENLHWSGGTASLVQVGDLLDRGVDVRGVMDLLMRLQIEAAHAGGEVVCLLGNHEAMNLLGIVRDVNPEAFAQFADEGSFSLRQQVSQTYARCLENRNRLLGVPAPEIGPARRDHLLDEFPLGRIEYLQALGPDGAYGIWLRTHPVAVLRSGVLFVHGGIGPAMRGMDLAAINLQAEKEISRFDTARAVLASEQLVLATAAVQEVREVAGLVSREAAIASGGNALTLRRLAFAVDDLDDLDDWALLNRNGPLWFRGATEWDEAELGDVIAETLVELDADRMVVGHTPRRTGSIEQRLDGRVFAIDTGMLSSVYTGGRPSALEFAGDAVSAIYLDGRQVLVDGAAAPVSEGAQAESEQPAVEPWQAWLDVDGNPLPFRTDAELEQFLLNAEVVENSIIGRGVTNPHKLLLVKDGVRAHATFKDINDFRPGATRSLGKAHMNFHDYHLYEVAAFKVDRLLGLGRVPPAVPRTIDGTKGTVQMWLEGTIMDVDRRDWNLSPPDPLRWRQQRQMMDVFDNLIGNADSNMGNLLIDRSWTLWFIDHTRAFVRVSKPLYPERIIFCERGLWEGMQALDETVLTEELSPYLNRFEIKAIMSRRDALVVYIQGLIDERGEEYVIYDLLPPQEPVAEWARPAED